MLKALVLTRAYFLYIQLQPILVHNGISLEHLRTFIVCYYIKYIDSIKFMDHNLTKWLLLTHTLTHAREKKKSQNENEQASSKAHIVFHINVGPFLSYPRRPSLAITFWTFFAWTISNDFYLAAFYSCV